MTGTALLEVRGLRVQVRTNAGIGYPVIDADLELMEGETLGLVGESGCGKSTLALAILGLLPKRVARVVGGECLFRGIDLLRLSERELRRFRGRHIAIVLQDPLAALNPVLTIGTQVADPIRLHRGLRGPALNQAVVGSLESLRVADAGSRLKAFPHQFSGGMRQRVSSAIALGPRPEILIADEPVSSLDAIASATYLDVLDSLQREYGTSIIFISHDLGIVRRFCHRVAVMYGGRIIEIGKVENVLETPSHPYTKALLASTLGETGSRRPERLNAIEGTPPSIFKMPQGCPFAPRCPVAFEPCSDTMPENAEVEIGHSARCWKNSQPLVMH